MKRKSVSEEADTQRGGETISKAALLAQLKAQISDEELAALRERRAPFPISEYNRETILRMMAEERYDGKTVRKASVEGLIDTLRHYLSHYMPETPDAHKWIIICCVFLVMVAGEPMHPQQIVRWEVREGKYFCPARDSEKDSVCRYCVCRKK